MTSTLDNIEFLSRSPHRVEVLEALANGPKTRHELRERADVSRVTMRRMLEDFEDRSWITHDNGQYEATPRGRVVSWEFARLQANMDTADQLADALPWLPLEEFDFDLAHLHDADVLLTSTWESQSAAISHVTDLVHESQHIRGTSIGFSHGVPDTIRDLVLENDGRFEAVVNDTAFRMIRDDDDLRQPFREMLASSNADLYRYTGNAPLHMVMAFDEMVSICGHVDEGPPPGTLETSNDTVLSWALSYYDSAREDSQPLAAEDLVPEQREST